MTRVLCGASNRRYCCLPWGHPGPHEWTHNGKRFRWRNSGKAVKRKEGQ